jgi:hypothetical protein
MKIKYLAAVVMIGALLAGCRTQSAEDVWEQNFQPYVTSQAYAFPGTYPVQSWAYQAGTQPEAIAQKWRDAGLIMEVRSFETYHVMTIGPQFYNLSYSSQRGLTDAVSRMYHTNLFRLKDRYTKKIVGTYTSPKGLQLY